MREEGVREEVGIEREHIEEVGHEFRLCYSFDGCTYTYIYTYTYTCS